MTKIMLDAPVEERENVAATAPAAEPDVAQSEPAEPKSALAIGLPAAWSIEPPAVVVRRKARAI